MNKAFVMKLHLIVIIEPSHLKSKGLQRDWIQSCDQVYIVKFIIYVPPIIYYTAFQNVNLILVK